MVTAARPTPLIWHTTYFGVVGVSWLVIVGQGVWAKGSGDEDGRLDQLPAGEARGAFRAKTAAQIRGCSMRLLRIPLNYRGIEGFNGLLPVRDSPSPQPSPAARPLLKLLSTSGDLSVTSASVILSAAEESPAYGWRRLNLHPTPSSPRPQRLSLRVTRKHGSSPAEPITQTSPLGEGDLQRSPKTGTRMEVSARAPSLCPAAEMQVVRRDVDSVFLVQEKWRLSQRIRMAQYGTKHGHAEGVLKVILANPEVEMVGVYEPDPGPAASSSSLRQAALARHALVRLCRTNSWTIRQCSPWRRRAPMQKASTTPRR